MDNCPGKRPSSSKGRDARKPPFRPKGAATISGSGLDPESTPQGTGLFSADIPGQATKVWRKGHVPAYSSIPTEHDSGPRAVQRGGRDRRSSVSRKA